MESLSNKEIINITKPFSNLYNVQSCRFITGRNCWWFVSSEQWSRVLWRASLQDSSDLISTSSPWNTNDGAWNAGTGTNMCFSTHGWFVLSLVREKVLLTSLCERKIFFRLKIYYHLRQDTAKRTLDEETCKLQLAAVLVIFIFYPTYVTSQEHWTTLLKSSFKTYSIWIL